MATYAGGIALERQKTKKELRKKSLSCLALAGILTLLLAYLTTPIHEVGHVLGAKIIGTDVTEIKLLTFGFFENMGHVHYSSASPASDWITGICGGGLASFVLLLFIGLFFGLKKRIGFKVSIIEGTSFWPTAIIVALSTAFIVQLVYMLFEAFAM